MSRRSNAVDQAEQLRVLAESELRRHIIHRADCDGQLPMFDAPLPARPATPAPSAVVQPESGMQSSQHIDFLKRVLVAKYLRRVLKCSYRHIGMLLNVDGGTAHRLDQYKLALEPLNDREAVPAERVMGEIGMTMTRDPDAASPYGSTNLLQ